MAHTWQPMTTSQLPAQYSASVKEGPDSPMFTQIRRSGSRFLYTTALPGQPGTTLPVEAIVGGSRHAFGFLTRIAEVGGLKLERPALIQTRYAWNPERERLVLAPGCPVEKPRSYETAFGLVLDPAYERKCLSCHGQPNTLGAGKEGGVQCESCHGPGWQHLQGVSKGKPQAGIVNPKRLNTEESIAICAQCHVSFSRISDPSPEDPGLLVANQVTALRGSECFIQSGSKLACTTCHDPHKDAEEGGATSVRACLGCHSTAATPRAAICPVNSTDACLGCHMPAVQIGPFHLVDHRIRVHPEQKVIPPTTHRNTKSQVPPRREFLRMISTKDRASAESAAARIANGEAFSKVARDVSSSNGLTGGYMGPQWLAELDPALGEVAARLRYGQTSGVFAAGQRWILLERPKRDFMWEAEQLQNEAQALAVAGNLSGALLKCQEALVIYPQALRSLLFMAKTLGTAGNPKRGIEVLRISAKVYPEDAEVNLSLALMLDVLGRRSDAMEVCRRALSLDSGLVPAYEYLGSALYSSEDLEGAVSTFRQGLQANPLSADLYYGLSLALARRGNADDAKNALAVAMKIDPDILSRKR